MFENANPNILMALVFLITLIIFGCVVGALEVFSGQKRAGVRRLERIKIRHSPSANAAAQAKMRRIVAEQQNNAMDRLAKDLIPNPDEMRLRLARTGKKISLGQYGLICLITGAIAGGLTVFVAGFPPILGVFGAISAGVGLPHMYVGGLINKRLAAFNKMFPDAIDLIVRGLKSGLPVTESLGAAGKEFADPIGTEFTEVVDKIRFGKTMEQALWEAAQRLTTPDFKFFVITLSIQRETGGNLAETLGNLSDILRKRQQLKLKIKAMSSEGKASAYIIGALPFLMFGIILLMNYDYASTLFTDPRAIAASVGGMLWMGIGAFIISKMINFEY